jgi:hypothetical protein
VLLLRSWRRWSSSCRISWTSKHLQEEEQVEQVQQIQFQDHQQLMVVEEVEEYVSTSFP